MTPPDGQIDPRATPPNPDAVTGTSFGVQRLHAEVIHEHTDPRDGFEPPPMWVLAIFGALLMWGGYYLGVESGGFRPDANDRPNPPAVAPLPDLPATTPAIPPTGK